MKCPDPEQTMSTGESVDLTPDLVFLVIDEKDYLFAGLGMTFQMVLTLNFIILFLLSTYQAIVLFDSANKSC